MVPSTTYLLTVRRPAAGGFRADLRAVDDEATLAFDSAAALLQHLLTAPLRTRADPADHPPLPAAEPRDARPGGTIAS